MCDSRIKRVVLCPKHQVEMRPIEIERGRMVEMCYICEREKEGDAPVKKRPKRDRNMRG
jgi:hypothetical protein